MPSNPAGSKSSGKFVRGLLDLLEANEQRALAINAYFSADGSDAAIVQITPDADAIRQYWRLVHQHTGRTLGRFVENPTSAQIYGATGDLMLERTRHSAEAGVALTVMPEHLAGFTRLAPVAS